jgi:site-specific recombinase XerD
LKAFLKYAYPEKDWSFVRYSQLKVSHEVIALSEEELGVIMHADVSGHLDKTRDLFVFLALTGMRFCDSQRFHLSWVTPENILEFNQLKTGGKAYPPLYDASRRVLDKYNGSPPLISQQKFNSYLKELFKKIKLDRTVIVHVVKGKQVYSSVEPLYNVISSHTARRTFITICLEKGMQIQDVMRMSGHSDYASMKPYMRVTRKHIRDIADKWSI